MDRLPARAQEPVSLTDSFTEELRRSILTGAKAPDERLHLETLKNEFEVSVGTVREGIARLVAEGLLVPNGRRGYRVAPISIEELVDIKNMRIELELKALRESIRLGDEEWELQLIIAFQTLKAFEARRWQADELEKWEARHSAFHRALVSASDSPITLRFCGMLHEMSDRYRRSLLTAHEPDRDVVGEHEALFDAALARDADSACEVLRTHIERTTENVLRVMRTNKEQAKPKRGSRG